MKLVMPMQMLNNAGTRISCVSVSGLNAEIGPKNADSVDVGKLQRAS